MVVLRTPSEFQHPVLDVDRFSYAYPGAADYTLRKVSMRIEPGECHLLEGPTGAGKSTLLRAIRGVLPVGRCSGSITLAGGAGTRSPGLVQQNPKTQLLCAGLGADIAFGLENHCIAPQEMAARVNDGLKRAGLNRPLTIPVDTLSMGQQYRACLAGQLVLEPQLIMLDEPVAQLDPRGREKTMEVICRFKEMGGAVLICEHRFEVLLGIIDRRWHLDAEGHLTEVAGGKQVATDRHDTAKASLPPKNVDKSDERARAAIRVSGPKFRHRYGELDLSRLDFTVGQGECVVVAGANGSGKTTLIRAIAGLVRPVAGHVEICGAEPKLRQLRGRLAVLFQDPAKQLFETTVFEEVAFAARRSGLTGSEVKARVQTLLAALGIEELIELSPHGLSYGQKHLVGLAAVLATNPEVLLLDDPFAGLDRKCADSVMRLVGWMAREQGMAVVWTSHDPDPLRGWADRVVKLAEWTGPQEERPADQCGPSEADIIVPLPERNYRLPAGVMLTICMVLSMLAFAARTYDLLAGLSVANLTLLFLFCREPLKVLAKSAILLFWQGAFILLLYAMRFGWEAGSGAGGQVAWQLFLAFWPGMIFMSSCSQPAIVRALARVLPQQAAFVSATCLRFLPMLLSEMQEIREVQILRGARILVADMKNPKNWPDWFTCLMIPALLKTFTLADDIATAAKARDFGILPRRTAWPGD